MILFAHLCVIAVLLFYSLSILDVTIVIKVISIELIILDGSHVDKFSGCFLDISWYSRILLSYYYYYDYHYYCYYFFIQDRLSKVQLLQLYVLMVTDNRIKMLLLVKRL